MIRILVVLFVLWAFPAAAERGCWVNPQGIPGYCGHSQDSKAQKLERRNYTFVPSLPPSFDHVWQGEWVVDPARRDKRERAERVHDVNIIQALIRVLIREGVIGLEEFTGDEREAIRRLLP